MISEIFLTFSVTSFIGCILAVANLCYRSKCKEIGFCCITIKRDVAIEEVEDLEMMRTNKSTAESKE